MLRLSNGEKVTLREERVSRNLLLLMLLHSRLVTLREERVSRNTEQYLDIGTYVKVTLREERVSRNRDIPELFFYRQWSRSARSV